MSPGEEELRQGIPLVGPTGYMLWWTGAQVGFRRDQTRLMNVCNCWPGSRDQKNPKLTAAQINACWARFDRDLMASSPRVILCLGNDAFKRVTGMKGGMDGRYGSRGYLIRPAELPLRETRVPVTVEWKQSKRCPSCTGTGKKIYTAPPPTGTWEEPCHVCSGTGWAHRKGDPRIKFEKQMLPPPVPASVEYIVATYHPSFILKKKKRITRALLQDADRAWRAATVGVRPLEVAYYDRPVDLGAGLVAFDIETDGDTGPINRIGFSSDTATWTAPWNTGTIEAARTILGDAERLKVGHNISTFDIPRLRAVGVDVPGRIFDTMVCGMMIEPDMPKGLASMAPLYLDLGRWKHKAHDPARAGEYNALDNVIERELARAQIEIVRDWGMERLVFGTVMPSLHVLNEMHERGIRVDQPRLLEWNAALSERQVAATTAWFEQQPDIDPAKTHQISKLLYKTLGLEKQFDVETGELTTDITALRTLRGVYPQYERLLDTLIEVRFVEKRLSTYAAITPLADGKVHPRFLPRGKDEVEHETQRKGTAATGRLAAANPPIQQIDKKDPEARSIFVPAEPDWVLVSWDWEQAELRVAAWASRDQALIADLENGVDVHGELSRMVGIPRDAGKQGVYLTLYGGGGRKLTLSWRARGLKVSPGTGERFQAAMRQKYPRLMAWRSGIVSLGVAQGFVVNHFGRRRHFWRADKDAPAMMDFIPQSDVADMTWDRLRPVRDVCRLFDGYLLAQIHDEFLAECHRDVAPQLALAGAEILRHRFHNVAPDFFLPVEAKIGPNWRALEKVRIAS